MASHAKPVERNAARKNTGRFIRALIQTTAQHARDLLVQHVVFLTISTELSQLVKRRVGSVRGLHPVKSRRAKRKGGEMLCVSCETRICELHVAGFIARKIRTLPYLLTNNK